MAKKVKPVKLNLDSREMGAIFYYLFHGRQATDEQLDELQKQVEEAIQ